VSRSEPCTAPRTRVGPLRSSKPRSWAEKRLDEERNLGYTEQPYIVIVGGGQGGIALGARLRQLGVPAIVIDRHERPGDQWRKRYKSLCLHDPVWYDHLPYLPFPQNWPVFAPKDKIGDWLEFYTRAMEVPYWRSTTCLSASFDEAEKRWTVELDRNGERVTLRPAQLVLATGMSDRPFQDALDSAQFPPAAVQRRVAGGDRAALGVALAVAGA